MKIKQKHFESSLRHTIQCPKCALISAFGILEPILSGINFAGSVYCSVLGYAIYDPAKLIRNLIYIIKNVLHLLGPGKTDV